MKAIKTKKATKTNTANRQGVVIVVNVLAVVVVAVARPSRRYPFTAPAVSPLTILR